MKIGFIGTGIITTAVATGFCESGMEDLHITISPRNKERAETLRDKYPGIISIASDNQAVIDSSDWIFLAVLTSAAEDIIRELCIPPEKKFINLVATLSLKAAEEIIGKREILVDVVPLTFAADRFGPIIVYPPVPEVKNLLSYIGEVVEVETPEQMSVLRSITCLMSPYYMLLTKLIDWCRDNGMEEAAARHYVTSFTAALSKKAAGWDGELEDLAREMTPGGLNWKALTHLENEKAFEPWTEILGEVLGVVSKG